MNAIQLYEETRRFIADRLNAWEDGRLTALGFYQAVLSNFQQIQQDPQKNRAYFGLHKGKLLYDLFRSLDVMDWPNVGRDEAAFIRSLLGVTQSSFAASR